MCSNLAFPSCILFIEEAGFSRDGIISFHNQDVWANENQHGAIRSRHQQQFSLKRMVRHCSSQNFSILLTSTNFDWGCLADFLKNSLPELFQYVKLQTGIHVWFMHDGTLPHFLHAVLDFLNSVFMEYLIGWGGPIALPGCSPDLNSLRFYLWGPPKPAVYATEVSDVRTCNSTCRMDLKWFIQRVE